MSHSSSMTAASATATSATSSTGTPRSSIGHSGGRGGLGARQRGAGGRGGRVRQQKRRSSFGLDGAPASSVARVVSPSDQEAEPAAKYRALNEAYKGQSKSTMDSPMVQGLHKDAAAALLYSLSRPHENLASRDTFEGACEALERSCIMVRSLPGMPQPTHPS